MPPPTHLVNELREYEDITKSSAEEFLCSTLCCELYASLDTLRENRHLI